MIRWRKECGGLRVNQARRFEELEKEDTKIKMMNIHALKHAYGTRLKPAGILKDLK